jgi:predicted peptidase
VALALSQQNNDEEKRGKPFGSCTRSSFRRGRLIRFHQNRMRHYIIICLFVFANSFVGIGNAQPPQQIDSNEQEKTFTRQSLKTFSGNYLLYLPDHYAEQPKQSWPVLLYLHSSDARSTDLQKVKREGLPYVLRTGAKLPFIVVAPLCSPDEWWDSRWSLENLNVLVDELIEKYRVDSRRIYLTGWSMGGAGSWKLANDYSIRFAAVAPISGRTQIKYAAQLRNTPVWAFHGAKDTIVPVSESQKLIDALQNIGGNARLTIFPDTGHDAWQQAYNDPQFYEWLLKYSNKDTPTQ